MSEETARLLLASVRDYAIYTLDLEGHVTSWNAGAENIKGYSADEIIGRSFEVFHTPEDRAAGQPEHALHAAAAGRFETEQLRVRKDGSRFWANVVMTPLRSEGGALVGFAKVTRDLTDRREREEERVRLARAEELLRVRDEFFSDTHRRLDSVIAGLRVHLGALAKTVESIGGGAGDVQARLKMMEWGIERLVLSIDQVLELAQKASDRMADELEAIRTAGSSGEPRARHD